MDARLALCPVQLRSVSALAALCFSMVGAFAQTAPLKPAAGPSDTCICRAQGRDWKLGESVCIQTSSGPRMAVCGMVLNNTSWQQTDQSCPLASAPYSRIPG